MQPQKNFCTLTSPKYIPAVLLEIPIPLLGSQAVENVGTVLANILRTQGRMEDTSKKLQALATEEAEKFIAKYCVTPVIAVLESYHESDE